MTYGRIIELSLYGCILGNWLKMIGSMVAHHCMFPVHQFVVLTMTSKGYIRIIETDDEELAKNFVARVDEGTESLTAFLLDRKIPADLRDIQQAAPIDSLPEDVEDREQLMAIMRQARQYW